jgi:two-component system OmpR family response regulator
VPRNLLIVEDDTDITETLCQIFADRGFDARCAPNGQDAISLANNHGFRPDAILLDLVMPVMDGLEFLEVRGAEPLLADVPVVVMSAQLDRLGGYRHSVFAALAKPIDLKRLLETVDRACKSTPAPAYS